MIDVQSLSMRYGSFVALDSISFKAQKGEILGLLGPNGAGKTTTMRILTTFLYPASGTATVNGLDIIKNSIEVRKQIGYLPETLPLYTEMRVDEYLEFVAMARGFGKKQLQERLDWIIESCGLKLVWKHSLHEISKGYKQRVGLAQALIHDPQVLILDEPTSGLDPLQIIGIRDLIKNLAKEKTVIFSTHILQEVEAIADRVVIINEGKIVAAGTQEELEKQVRQKSNSKEKISLENIFISLLKPTNEISGASASS